MAIDCKLQINTSTQTQLDKDISDIMILSGALKADTSIIDPIIMIDCNLSDVVQCNYMTIPSFGRSYFVNSIRAIRTGLIEFGCHVDVLSSYAAEIRRNTAIIARQEREWNLYLNDGSLRVYQNPNILTKAFPSGFRTQEFVLAVAGR